MSVFPKDHSGGRVDWDAEDVLAGVGGLEWPQQVVWGEMDKVRCINGRHSEVVTSTGLGGD